MPSVNDSLKRVAFDAHAYYNRIEAGDDVGLLPKWRMFAVRNELGGRIDVDYGHQPGRACDEDYLNGANNTDPTDDVRRWQSTRECFALADGEAPLSDPQFDWYHKYVVRRVALSDDATGYRYDSPFDGLGPATPAPKPAPSPGQVQVTEYEYDGDPAWRYSQSLNVPLQRESWSDWRGYGQP